LDAGTVAFISNEQENRLEGTILYVSSIFKWFKEDFQNNPIDFFEKYAQGDLKNELISQKGRIKIKYLSYDWSLNGKEFARNFSIDTMLESNPVNSNT